MGTQLRDIMTRDVQTVTGETSIFEAARLMKQIDIGIVPVVEEQRLVGLLTDRDIVMRVVAAGRDPMVVNVDEVMTRTVTAASPDWDVSQAAQIMGQEQIRRLPVVEDGRLVGIVSLGDVAVDVDREQMSGQTLEEISRPAKPAR